MIGAEYGVENTAGYISRFIDLEYELPAASDEQFAELLFSRLEINDYFNGRSNGQTELRDLLKSAVQFSKMFGFSLRTFERYLTQMAVILRTTPPNKLFFPTFAAFLTALKVAKPTIFRDFVTEAISSEEVLKIAQNLPGGVEYFSSYQSVRVEAHLVTSFIDHDERGKIMERYVSMTLDESLSGEVQDRARAISETLKHNYLYENVNVVRYLAKKLNFAQGFAA